LQGQGYLYRFDHGDNINKALKAFQAAIEIDSNYADAYVGLAEAQLRSFIESKDVNLLVAMANTVAQLRELDSDHSLLSYLEGELNLNQGNYEDAVELFRKSTERIAKFLKAYIGLSNSFTQLGQSIKAEQVLLSAYELMPNNGLVLSNLGAFHYRDGNYNQAIKYFELLAQQVPNNFTAQLNISACHYLIGDIEKALLSAQEALRIQRNFIVYSNIGTYYFILREYEQAVEAFEQMIVLNESDYINWGNLADAYRFANNNKFFDSFKKAITLAEQAIVLNPSNKYAIASLAYYYANIENTDKALNFARQITEKDLGEDQFFIAATYARLNMDKEAIKYLEYAITNSYSIAEIVNSPLFDNLKDNLQYQQFTKRVLP
jgi:serine/threonine-protein kinase